MPREEYTGSEEDDLFKPVDPRVDFPRMEEHIISFWETNDIFRKSIAQRDRRQQFVFFDGPPFATGLPHFGHFVPGTIKDIIPRYQTMKGRRSTADSAGTATACPWSTRWRRSWASPGRRRSRSTGSPASTRPAAPSSCATPGNGADGQPDGPLGGLRP
jgi:hypothetical protein